MSKKTYSNEDITVIWKPDVCIHSTNCWKASLKIFNPKRRPWIDTSAGTTDEIIKNYLIDKYTKRFDAIVFDFRKKYLEY